MYDRFHSKNQRVRQSNSIIDHRREVQELVVANREFKAKYYLKLVEELTKRPGYYESPVTAELIAALKRGEFSKLRFLQWRTLNAAMDRTLIGPIQRKVRTVTEASKKWRKGIERLGEIQASRPLKPPGR